jgi:F-type H+-transporting ATPase subunit b
MQQTRSIEPRRDRLVLSCAAVAAAIASLIPSLAGASEGGLNILPELPPFMADFAHAIGAPVGWKLVILLLLFPALLPFVNSLVIKPLLRVLDEREARITGTRAKADKLEQDAAAILLRYEQSIHATRDEGERNRRTVLAEVRAETQREITAARGEAERRLEQARGEIAAALASARESLRNETRDLARQAASQVLGRAL